MNLISAYNRRTFLQRGAITVISGALGACALAESSASPETKSKKKLFKKGIGITMKIGTGWQKKLELLNLDWHYSWGGRRPADYPDGIQFVPMVWGRRGLTEIIAYLKEQQKAGTLDSLLSFNEPDGKEQSNMTVQDAIEAWPTLMETGLRLGSPACVHPDNDWMKDFMKQAKQRQFRVDFVTVHDYGGGNSKALIDKCKHIYEMFGKPLWITEFAVGDWQASKDKPNRHSPQKVLDFMQEVLPALDKLECVEKYAWFPAALSPNTALGTSALFNPDGQLTTLGQCYARHQSVSDKPKS